MILKRGLAVGGLVFVILGASWLFMPARLSIIATSSTTASREKTGAAVAGDTSPTASVEAGMDDDAGERVSFDAELALAHIKYLSKTIGARPAGGKNERLASCYIKDELDELGYKTSIQKFTLPNGQHSYNVVGFVRGADDKSVIFGAHFDSKGGPGANDNASGAGVLLETARVVANGGKPPHSLYFVFFGAEERIGAKRSDHHFGSRYYVSKLTKTQKTSTLAMINVDMVGKGTELAVRSQRAKPSALAGDFMQEAARLKLKNLYKQGKDDSDYEAFENAGIPSIWLQWRNDTNWHTKKDTFERIEQARIGDTGKLLDAYIAGL